MKVDIVPELARDYGITSAIILGFYYDCLLEMVKESGYSGEWEDLRVNLLTHQPKDKYPFITEHITLKHLTKMKDVGLIVFLVNEYGTYLSMTSKGFEYFDPK